MGPERSRSPPRSRRYRGNELTAHRSVLHCIDRYRYVTARSRDHLCRNCRQRQPGHYARECPNVAVCNNCGLPGHLAAECSGKTLCWNCMTSGHVANHCPNDPVCRYCCKPGHLARGCPSLGLESRLCNNCCKPGHLAADCTNVRACNNCRQSAHLAWECPNEPICYVCNSSGHLEKQCPKTNVASEIHGGPLCNIACLICNEPGHNSRDCATVLICSYCRGRGHLRLEWPLVRFVGRGHPGSSSINTPELSFFLLHLRLSTSFHHTTSFSCTGSLRCGSTLLLLHKLSPCNYCGIVFFATWQHEPRWILQLVLPTIKWPM